MSNSGDGIAALRKGGAFTNIEASVLGVVMSHGGTFEQAIVFRALLASVVVSLRDRGRQSESHYRQ